MKVILFNAKACNGCYGCQLACKDEHCGNDWLPISAAQPDTGQFWCKMQEVTHGQTPKVRIQYTPLFCNHCDDAPCVKAFPECVYKRDDGLVIIDPEKAKGMKGLMEACPYGAIYWNEGIGLPQKCTGCAHLVDEGELPHCVDVCATGALRFGDEEEFVEELADAQVLTAPEHGGRVYYLNMPRLFISGEVWDPQIDEIIEGAKVTLLPKGGAKIITQSDDMGDFWFNDIEVGEYRLIVEVDGYKIEERDVNLEESLNVGDFPMARL